jgi:uncharacterized protein with PQ loop repeat
LSSETPKVVERVATSAVSASEVLGFGGAVLAAYAYAPQIAHLVREQCSAGISLRAFSLWFTASALLATHAVAIADPVFAVLGLFQLVATGVILFYGHQYRYSVCPWHRDHPGADAGDRPPTPVRVRVVRHEDRDA